MINFGKNCYITLINPKINYFQECPKEQEEIYNIQNFNFFLNSLAAMFLTVRCICFLMAWNQGKIYLPDLYIMVEYSIRTKNGSKCEMGIMKEEAVGFYYIAPVATMQDCLS